MSARAPWLACCWWVRCSSCRAQRPVCRHGTRLDTAVAVVDEIGQQGESIARGPIARRMDRSPSLAIRSPRHTVTACLSIHCSTGLGASHVRTARSGPPWRPPKATGILAPWHVHSAPISEPRSPTTSTPAANYSVTTVTPTCSALGLAQKFSPQSPGGKGPSASTGATSGVRRLDGRGQTSRRPEGGGCRRSAARAVSSAGSSPSFRPASAAAAVIKTESRLQPPATTPRRPLPTAGRRRQVDYEAPVPFPCVLRASRMRCPAGPTGRTNQVQRLRTAPSVQVRAV